MKKLFIIKLFVFIVVAFNSTNLLSKNITSFGIVKLVRGTVIRIGADLKKQKLKSGNKLIELDRIISAKKSLIVISLYDGSTISLGPASSIALVKKNSKKPSLLYLFKGMIDASIKKKKNNRYNFHIITKTASIGVRGTSFKLIYNRQNKISSILTYQGSVDFKKHRYNHYLDEIPPEQTFENEYNLEIQEDLDNYKTKSVTKGKISTTASAKKVASNPIYLANNQFVKLENSSPLGKIKARKTERETFQNQKIKSDGYLDLQTGIYISPPLTLLLMLNPRATLYQKSMALLIKKMVTISHQKV